MNRHEFSGALRAILLAAGNGAIPANPCATPALQLAQNVYHVLANPASMAFGSPEACRTAQLTVGAVEAAGPDADLDAFVAQQLAAQAQRDVQGPPTFTVRHFNGSTSEVLASGLPEPCHPGVPALRDLLAFVEQQHVAGGVA